MGIDPEIAAAVCEKMGYDLEIVDTEFDSLISGVASGKYDFVMAGMTVTEERKQIGQLLGYLRHRRSGHHRQGRQPHHQRG